MPTLKEIQFDRITDDDGFRYRSSQDREDTVKRLAEKGLLTLRTPGRA